MSHWPTAALNDPVTGSSTRPCVPWKKVRISNCVECTATATPPAPESTPFYKRGWFWGVTAGVVAVAVVGALWAAGVFSKSSDPCAGRSVCLPAAGGP